jgi:hypothetical protein
MKLMHRFQELAPEKRPQDPHLDGTGLRFETMEHGGEYPDTMPQAIKLIDAEGRSCIYVPIMQDGKVVDSQGQLIQTTNNDGPNPDIPFASLTAAFDSEAGDRSPAI